MQIENLAAKSTRPSGNVGLRKRNKGAATLEMQRGLRKKVWDRKSTLMDSGWE
jgi:hypothetical protein